MSIAAEVARASQLVIDQANTAAKSLITAVHNVQGYGAKGDGIADDTAAIQAAIEAAGLAGGGLVYIPPGKYNVTGTLQLTGDNVTIQGAGRGCTRIDGQGAVSPILKIGNATANVRRCRVADLMITRTLGAASKTGTVGLLYAKSRHPELCSFENLQIYGSATNAHTGDAGDRPEAITYWVGCEFGKYDSEDSYSFVALDGIEQKFMACRFQGFSEAGFIAPSGGNPNDWHFTNCYFGSVSHSFGGTGGKWATRINSGFAHFFNSCIFEEGREADVLIEAGKIIKLTGCMVGGGGRTGFGIKISGAAAEVTQVTITGGEIRDVGQVNSLYPGTANCIRIDGGTFGANRISICGVTIRSDALEALRIDAPNVAITGCTISQTTNNSAINMTANADAGAITGNVLVCQALTAGKGAVNLALGTEAQVVVGNVMRRGAGVAVVNSGAASNVVASNADVA